MNMEEMKERAKYILRDYAEMKDPDEDEESDEPC